MRRRSLDEPGRVSKIVRAAAILLLIALAGCTSGPSPSLRPASAPAPLAGLHYGCPGQADGAAPCVTPWPLQPPYFGEAQSVWADAHTPGRIAVMTRSEALAGPEAPQLQTGTIPGRTGVRVSHDGGVSWGDERLVARGGDPTDVPGTLLFGDGTWTSSGQMAMAAYEDARPEAEVGNTSAGLGSVGPVWVGESSDEGRTWTSATMPGEGGAFPRIAEVRPGVLTVAWSDQAGDLRASWQLPDGTWHGPILGPLCDFPSKPVGDDTGFLVGCWERSAGSDDLPVLHVDLADGAVEARATVEAPAHDSGCTPAGPILQPDGSLVAVMACGHLHLERSTDAAATWQAFGDAATPPLRGPAFPPFVAVSGQKDGAIVAFAMYGYPQRTGGCACDYTVVGTVWGPDGRLLESRAWVDHASEDPRGEAPLDAVEASSAGNRTWAVVPDGLEAFGWVATAPGP